jgi:hypothetical protein
MQIRSISSMLSDPLPVGQVKNLGALQAQKYTVFRLRTGAFICLLACRKRAARNSGLKWPFFSRAARNTWSGSYPSGSDPQEQPDVKKEAFDFGEVSIRAMVPGVRVIGWVLGRLRRSVSRKSGVQSRTVAGTFLSAATQ